MPRNEKPLADCLQHLAELAGQLRAARQGANMPTYESLSRRSDPRRSISTLSRAASGDSLPTWETTQIYLGACRISLLPGELAYWRGLWDRASAAHELYLKAQKERGSATAAVPVGLPPAPVTSGGPVDASRQLVHDLKQITNKEGLIDLVWELGRRNGFDSLRKLSAQTGVPRSTLNGWLRGERRPSPDRLSALVGALGASQVERSAFVLTLDRVWFGLPPELINRYMTNWGEGNYTLTMVLSGRHILAGELTLHRSPGSVQGISIGSELVPAQSIELGPSGIGTVWVINIWANPAVPLAGRQLQVVASLETSDAIWAIDIATPFPTEPEVTELKEKPVDRTIAEPEVARDSDHLRFHEIPRTTSSEEDFAAAVDIALQLSDSPTWQKTPTGTWIFDAGRPRTAAAAGPSPFTPVPPRAKCSSDSDPVFTRGHFTEKAEEPSPQPPAVLSSPPAVEPTHPTAGDQRPKHRREKARHRRPGWLDRS